MPSSNPRCYVTTAIPYVNATPHLGFALELCVADAYARHGRQRGRDVRFVTGTDDHSLKNVLAAERAGVATQAWVERHAAAFERLNVALEISADDFLRTSASPAHAPAVRALWAACAARGDLYRKAYAGRYCVGCERFFDPEELQEGGCPEHSAPLEVVEEENWFFRLSRYRQTLRDAIETGRLRIEHPGARAEALAFLRGTVRDISVSRSATRARGWGLAVPGDETQVIWVWFDALAHYLSALGYASTDPARFEAYWTRGRERVHVIGKGIVRFHAVYWPAFLASAGLPWPTDLLVHGYLTLDGEKISKSGRTVDPLELVARHGADAVRYYLLRHVRTDRDGDFSPGRFAEAHDAELANGLGNLASRLLGATGRIAAGVIPAPGPDTARDEEIRAQALALGAEVDAAVSRFALDEALSAVFRTVDEANRYVTREAPWKLAASGHAARARAVLRTSLEALNVIGAELGPFLPATSAALRTLLGGPGARVGSAWNVLPTGAALGRGTPLFPRIGG
jgi:methionyl-tRNA synthetase